MDFCDTGVTQRPTIKQRIDAELQRGTEAAAGPAQRGAANQVLRFTDAQHNAGRDCITGKPEVQHPYRVTVQRFVPLRCTYEVAAPNIPEAVALAKHLFSAADPRGMLNFDAMTDVSVIGLVSVGTAPEGAASAAPEVQHSAAKEAV